MDTSGARIYISFRNPVDQKLLCQYLTESGYEPVSSPSDISNCDLLFLDTSAISKEPAQQIARWKATSQWFLPVLLGIQMNNDPEPWLAAGFDDVIHFPTTKRTLHSRLELMLRLRRQSEALGRRHEYLYQALIESSADHIFVLDRNGRYISSNSRGDHFHLPTGKALCGEVLEAVFPAEVAALYRRHTEEVFATGALQTFEYSLSSPAETNFYITTLYPLSPPGYEQLVGGICRDITARKQAEQKLQASEELYRNIIENTGTATLIVNQDASIAFANEECQATTGYTVEELVGRAWQEFVHPEDLAFMESYFARRFTRPELAPQRYETRLINKAGETRHALLTVNVLPDAHQIIVSLLDITERTRAEEARRLLKFAVDHLTEGVFISDQHNKILYANQAMTEITGYSQEELRGKTASLFKSDKHSPEMYRSLKETIYRGQPWKGDLINRRKDGSTYEVSASIAPLLGKNGQITHFVSIHRDVTKEREIERRLRQHQRLEAIGALAGGIAHDFNNILSPIMGYTEFCMDALPTDSPLRDDLEQVMQAAERARDLIQQILSFSRQKRREHSPIQISPVLKETLKLLRASIPSTIHIKQDISPIAKRVIADPTEIHQVLMNLCTNASHAMPEGGTLTIRLRELTLTSEAARDLPGLKPGDYLKLTVQDTGHGIPRAIIDKIFEPYFTTKQSAHGTGLGLAVTHSIIASYDGTITVQSTPGKGTTFDVYLPTTTLPSTGSTMASSAPRHGNEHILFVDDDLAIATLGRKTLERYGYRVTTCTDPRKAFERFQADPMAFDLVVSDITMPNLTGEQLAEALLQLRRDLPIILCTGYSEKLNAERAKQIGVALFLSKPIAPSKLAESIRQLLNEAQTTH